MTVESRARRILGRGYVVGYRHVESDDDELSRVAPHITLAQNENVLGIYENPPPYGRIG